MGKEKNYSVASTEAPWTNSITHITQRSPAISFTVSFVLIVTKHNDSFHLSWQNGWLTARNKNPNN